MTFGGTVVVDALEIGEFAMSVCAAAYCGAAIWPATRAVARSRRASRRFEPRWVLWVFITFSCNREMSPRSEISTPSSGRS